VVEGEVFFCVGGDVALLGRFEDFLGEPSQFSYIAADPVGGEFGRELFEDRSHLVRVEPFFGGDLADPGAAVTLDLDHVEGFQLPEGFTHGGLARAELSGELHLDEPLTGYIDPLRDAAQDGVSNSVAHGFPIKGSIFCFHVGIIDYR